MTALRTSCPFLLCLAVGPGEALGAMELVEACRIYLAGPYRIVVVDDTGAGELQRFLRRCPEVDYLRNETQQGFAKLLMSLQRAYLHALDHYRFAALLKVDTDSLIIGPGLDLDILAHFAGHPEAGMLGSRSWRERDDSIWARFLHKHLDYWRPLMERAERHGYVHGESALGGAYALSYGCLSALRADGLLEIRPPPDPRLAEDVTMSLLVRAHGLEIHEFAGPSQPLALAWRGLPHPRQTLVALGKKATHSVKFTPDDLRIREYFARKRRHAALAEGAPRKVRALRISRDLRRHLRWTPLADRAMRFRHPSAARPLLAWLVVRRPWRAWLWVLLGLSCVPRPWFEGLVRGRRAATDWIGRARSWARSP